MCGIFGYFDKRGLNVDRNVIESMGNAIKHRGPDDQGIFYTSGVALGNQRLSIVDVAGGHQPFVSEDGNIVVVQNGEIFNYIELSEDLKKNGNPCKTNSDTEVLLRLYEQEGIKFVNKLNGMFAIAIYDKRQEALYLVRDRIGVKPLYLYNDGYLIFFASEIKSLFKAAAPSRVSSAALHNFLTYNYVPPSQTFFENISHIDPGTWVCFNRNSQKTHRWWNLADVHAEEKSEEEWIELFNETLDDAVRLRLRADVPFGAFLSGGVDSSTVVGLMSRHLKDPVKTFCIGFHDPNYDESSFAKKAATRFKTDHILEMVNPDIIELWPKVLYHCDQPHGDISFLPTYCVAHLASKYVKMVLTGDGADELFAGYDKYKSFFSSDVFSIQEKEFQLAYFRKNSLFSDDSKNSLYTPEFSKKVKHCNAFDIMHSVFAQVSHMDRINKVLFVDMQTLLPGNNLVKPDRMGMAASIEARTPFLDYRMMELAFKMPGHLKLHHGVTKYIYKKAVTPLIGEDLAYRKKQMFTVPVGDWFKGELAHYCQEMLLSKNAQTQDILNRQEVSRILLDHQAGYKNYTREIRALLALEISLRGLF